MNIQWYPGHMAKASRIMKEYLKQTDIVVILGDARAVVRSVSGDFIKMFDNKKCVYAYNKTDIADEAAVSRWKKEFENEEPPRFFIDCVTRKGINKLSEYLLRAKDNFRFDREVRVMIAGIPNVGKSMLINALSKRSSAKTGNRPGVTRGSNWVKVQNSLFLLDTPGILTPKFDNEADGVIIAAIGSVKDTIFDKQELAIKIIEFMTEKYPLLLRERYKINTDGKTASEIYENIGTARGFKLKGGAIDYERTGATVYDEFKNGVIGPICFDYPE